MSAYPGSNDSSHVNGFDVKLLHRAPLKKLKETTNLVIPKPDPLVCNSEGENMVYKRLAFGVILWCTKYLQEKAVFLNNLTVRGQT